MGDRLRRDWGVSDTSYPFKKYTFLPGLLIPAIDAMNKPLTYINGMVDKSQW